MKSSIMTVLVLSVMSFAAPPPGFVPSGTQWFPSVAVRYSDPLKLSGSIGATLMNLQPFGGYRGFFGQIEAGAGGGKASAGYRLGKHQFMPLYNIGLAGSVMHTWGNPLGDVESGETYLGVELSAALFVVSVNSGIYRHAAGDSEINEWIWTLGAGLGI